MTLQINRKPYSYRIQNIERILKQTPLCQKRYLGIPLASIIVLTLVAFCSQLPSFGSPISFTDQEFYMWAGGQILDGKIPYIDFWDRKQVGLFLLFSIFYLFESYRFFICSIVVSLFITGGSLAIVKIVQTLTRNDPLNNIKSFLAGISFIAGLVAFNGQAGQAEAFYVPIMLIAVCLLFSDYREVKKSTSRLFWVGCIIMTLTGVSLEIKATCLFLGVFLGIWLTSLIVINHSLSTTRKIIYLISFGTAWVFIAVLPTILILTWYAHHGWFDDWWFANISSASKRDLSFIYKQHRFKIIYGIILSIVGIALTYIVGRSINKQQHIHIKGTRGLILFSLCWFLIEATLSWKISTGRDLHYFIPVIPPAILIITCCLQSLLPISIASLVILLLGSHGAIEGGAWTNGSYRFYDRVSYLMDEQPGCLLQLNGYVILYDATSASHKCVVSKMAFPEHIIASHEKNAIPLNQDAERERALRSLPLYVLSKPLPDTNQCMINFSCRAWRKYYKSWLTTTDQRFRRVQEDADAFLLHHYDPVLAFNYTDNSRIILYKLKVGLKPHVIPKGLGESEISKPIYYPSNWSNPEAANWRNRK